MESARTVRAGNGKQNEPKGMNGVRLAKVTSLVFLVIALMFTGAAPAAQAADDVPRGGTLVLGVDQEAIGLDPNIITSFSSFRRVDLLYNALLRYDTEANVVPDLAQSWDVVDATTYVFHLREGVKFHNGREMTAEDVKYSIERVLDPATGSPGRSYLEPISEVIVVDDYTVEVRLEEATASLLDAFTSGNVAIVPREEIERHGDLQRTAVGTGPFMLESWTPDQDMVLVRNPDYFDEGLPYLDKIVFQVIPDQMSLLAGLRTGSLDAAHITEGSVLQVAQRDPSLTVLESPSLNLRTFGFNVTREPFDDARVRRAIALAIDRQPIIQAAEFGLGEPSAPMPSSAKVWAAPLQELSTYEVDLEEARRLLQEAGIPDNFRFDIVVSPTYEGGLAVAQVIQQQLRAIGLDAQLDVVEWGIYIDRWVQEDFDAMVELRGGGADPDRFLYRMIHSEGAVNNFLYGHPELDRLLEQGRRMTDVEERSAVYVEAQKLLADEAPYIGLYTPQETMVVREHVQGLELLLTGSFRHFDETWLQQ